MVKRIIAMMLLSLLLVGCSTAESTEADNYVSFPTEESSEKAETAPVATPDQVGEEETTPVDSTTPEPDVVTEETPETESNVATPTGTLAGKKICIDPGHGKFTNGYQEAIGPGSSKTKPAFVSGTSGQYQSEAEFNLKLSFELKELLEAEGALVYMTRTSEVAELSNIGRAEYANDLGCDMVVRIHADGSENTSVNGISVLIPGRNEFITDDYVINESHDAGAFVLNSLITATGSANRGLIVRTDLTGFNWSTVPSILVECGFMSNSEDDRKLADPSYRTKLAKGITEGLLTYYERV